jgi:hypothetical protein
MRGGRFMMGFFSEKFKEYLLIHEFSVITENSEERISKIQ